MENRSTIELLKIVREELVKREYCKFFSRYDGLCTIFIRLLDIGILSNKELDALENYITNSKRYIKRLKRNCLYLYKPYAILPRYIWLTKRIWIERIKSVWK